MSAPAVLWSAAEVLAATGGRGPADWRATGVSIDSRSLKPGELFFAVRGVRTDGHLFVAKAFEAGAAAAVVQRPVENLAGGRALVWVADTLAALNALAAAARARTRARIVAVTGSVGKTGTKEALALALGRFGPTHANPGSFNNQWGVPLSLARIPVEAAFGVFEMGMNHAGEIEPLSRLARPDVAVITAVEPVHLGHFASVDEIADAKAEIFAGLAPGGAAVLDRDNPHFARLAAAARARGVARVIGFGESPDAEARLVACHAESAASTVSAIVGAQPLGFRLNLAGRHWARNSLAVLAAVLALGLDVEAAAAALSAWQAGAGRGRRHRIALAGGGHVTLIDESYNASPAAVRAALAVLGSAQPGRNGRRILVLGDMLELGEAGPALHAGLAEAVATNRVDMVFTAGPLCAHLFAALAPDRRGAHAETAEALAPLVVAALAPGDVVAVKGSAGLRMGTIVRAILGAAPAPAAVNGEGA
ncbi:MAG: UDP-N-acetylmuramoylalanyl-D-glutamyl-2,6-diaminopimelate--D-alanyl-D-alanine ligase [Proteobacteria bacterium]|nr:UDP-N-acetylmuramoylalanyl-D-glutamyl-2,6-diaminopimelate--D-alanyl-D-alanine ligase [Pseudomonadota bacterium]